MSRILDKIIQHGWAQRRANQTDHRASVITITGTGETALDAARRNRATRLAAALAHLGPDDTAALLAAMPALETLADQAAGPSPRQARPSSAGVRGSVWLQDGMSATGPRAWLSTAWRIAWPRESAVRQPRRQRTSR